jgi:tetratricopeptide (TPR) repeat protein
MNSRLSLALFCFGILTIGYIPLTIAQSKPATVKGTRNSAQAKLYDDSALVKFRANNIAGALADLGLAITADPQDPQLYLHRGFIKGHAADHRGAITDFEQAIKLKPDLPEAFALRANSKRELKDTRGALSDYDRALSLSPQSVAIYIDRGRLKQMQLNDPKGAVSDYDKAIALGDRDAFTYSFRGAAKRSLGNRNGAIADFQESIRLAGQQSDPVYKRLIQANQNQLHSLGVKS